MPSYSAPNEISKAMNPRRALPLLLVFTLVSSAFAFLPYANKKFKGVKYVATGLGQKATGKVDFKFTNAKADSVKMPFKAKAGGRKVKGELVFKPKGKFQAKGIIPGFEKETVKGTYKIRGTTVIFEAEKVVNQPPLPKTKVTAKGRIQLLPDGNVKITIRLKSSLGSGKILIDSSKKGK